VEVEEEDAVEAVVPVVKIVGVVVELEPEPSEISAREMSDQHHTQR